MIGQPFSPFRVFTGIFIPDALIAFKGINAAEKICLGRLYRHCGKSSACFPSQELLAEELGVDIRSVQTYIKHLEDEGFVQIRQRGLGQSNEYFMLWHWVFSEEDGVSVPNPKGSSGTDPKSSSGQEPRTSSDPLHLSYEESHPKRSSVKKSTSSFSYENTEDNLSPKQRQSIFLSRLKKAGVKLNWQHSEKKQAIEWLEERQESIDAILGALDVFAANEHWTAQGHPWAAFKKQFDEFLEIAIAAAEREAQGVDQLLEDAGARIVPSVAPQAAQIDYPARWNQLVPAMPVSWDWKRGPVDALRLAELDDVFVARFDEMCAIVQKAHVECGKEVEWLTFEFAIRRSQKGWGWWRILTEFRAMKPRTVKSNVGENVLWKPGMPADTVEQHRAYVVWKEDRKARGLHTDPDKAAAEGIL